MAISIPLIAVEMSRHFINRPELNHHQIIIWQWIMAFATAWVVFDSGWPLLEKGWQSFRRAKLNMFSLIAPGILITFVYSLLALIIPDLFPPSLRHEHGVPVYFESAAMITALVLLGQFIEEKAERKTGSALEALARLSPARTCVIRNGVEFWVSADDLVIGDIVQLRAGDRVPADGSVNSGEALVDESMLTGEPVPVAKSAGQTITGGTIIREGAVTMQVDKIGPDTVLAHIIEMVRSAQESRAPIQRIADRVTGKLVPVVMLIALLTVIIWWRLGPQPALWYGLLHAVTVLMITCPCALGLATPLSIMTGLGRGALAGILVRDAASLEHLAGVNVVILDKTGTLTTGKPVLHACVPRSPGNESALLKNAASVEHLSHHPLASAVVEGARKWGLSLARVDQFYSVTGEGVGGNVDGAVVLVGNRKWLTRHEVSGMNALDSIATQMESDGRTVIWVSVDRQSAGLLAVSDQLKPHAGEAVQALRDRGIRLIMITGDSDPAANHVARQLKIDEVISGVLPGEKAGHVSSLKRQGFKVGMAGDGINDAPALASADVGIAVGTGTAVAISSGHVNLLHGDLMSLVNAIDLSRAVLRNIRQNLFFAFVYNAIMIPIAAGALFPWSGLMLTPLLASAAMSASSITVILNALRLRRLKLFKPVSEFQPSAG